MNLDPTLFASPMYETANEAVLFCKDFLQKTGHTQFAEQLAGFTPVSHRTVAVVVHNLLKGMQPRVTGEAAEYVAIALNTVARALGSHAIRAVA